VNVYFPNEAMIQVHHNRVKLCPDCFPAGYYWNGIGPGAGLNHLLSNVPITLESEESVPLATSDVDETKPVLVFWLKC